MSPEPTAEAAHLEQEEDIVVPPYIDLEGDEDDDLIGLLARASQAHDQQMLDAYRVVRNSANELVKSYSDLFQRPHPKRDDLAPEYGSGPDMHLDPYGGFPLEGMPTWDYDWDLIDQTPIEERLTGAWVNEIKTEHIPFLLGPVERSRKYQAPIKIIQKRADVLMRSCTLKTWQGYGLFVKRWIEFCDEIKLEVDLRCPADPMAVLDFLRDYDGDYSADYIMRHLTGLKNWHGLHGLELHVNPVELRLTKQALKLTQPPPKEAKSPVLINQLLEIVRGYDSTPTGTMLKAAHLTMFWGLLRRVEVTNATATSFNKKLKAKRRDIKRVEATETVPAHYVLHVPYDKSNRVIGRDVVIMTVHPDPELDPVAALDEHFRVNRIGTDEDMADEPLFAAISWKDKSLFHHLTKKYITKSANETLKKRGLPEITGHSNRIGGATFLLLTGVDPDAVKQIGGWKSDAYLRYWRELKKLAVQYLTEAASYTWELMDDELLATETGRKIAGPSKRKKTRAPR